VGICVTNFSYVTYSNDGFALLRFFKKNDKLSVQEVKKFLTTNFTNKMLAENLKVTIEFRQRMSTVV
jgi:hypothetical protein